MPSRTRYHDGFLLWMGVLIAILFSSVALLCAVGAWYAPWFLAVPSMLLSVFMASSAVWVGLAIRSDLRG